MADIKETLQKAGHAVSEAATKAGHAISEGAEKAADWVKEKTHSASNTADELGQKAQHKAEETFGSSTPSGVAAIKEHMDVIGSCGNKLGVVDHVQGDRIKLTKNDSPDGQHHFIPTSWVSKVDAHVHLSKNCGAAKAEWQAA